MRSTLASSVAALAASLAAQRIFTGSSRVTFFEQQRSL